VRYRNILINPPSECRLTIVSSSLARITRHRESERERERERWEEYRLNLKAADCYGSSSCKSSSGTPLFFLDYKVSLAEKKRKIRST
jgi:hypothetical protein